MWRVQKSIACETDAHSVQQRVRVLRSCIAACLHDRRDETALIMASGCGVGSLPSGATWVEFTAGRWRRAHIWCRRRTDSVLRCLLHRHGFCHDAGRMRLQSDLGALGAATGTQSHGMWPAAAAGWRIVVVGCSIVVSGSHATLAVGARTQQSVSLISYSLLGGATTPQLQLYAHSTTGDRPQT